MNADLAALMAELLAEFLDELPTRCHDLEEAILVLESGEVGAFDELFRQVHSLKGTGGGVGLPIITTICHQFESFLGEVRARFSKSEANTALSYVDLLRRTIPPQGREPAGLAAIEQSLEAMRVLRMSGRISILLAEPSPTLRKLYQEELCGPHAQIHVRSSGMRTLETLLHEPIDLLVVSRELPELNGLAVVAALREARCRNSDIPVIVISSNTASPPGHLRIHAIAKRDKTLITQLKQAIAEVQVKQH